MLVNIPMAMLEITYAPINNLASPYYGVSSLAMSFITLRWTGPPHDWQTTLHAAHTARYNPLVSQHRVATGGFDV